MQHRTMAGLDKTITNMNSMLWDEHSKFSAKVWTEPKFSCHLAWPNINRTKWLGKRELLTSGGKMAPASFTLHWGIRLVPILERGQQQSSCLSPLLSHRNHYLRNQMWSNSEHKTVCPFWDKRLEMDKYLGDECWRVITLSVFHFK